MWSWEEWGQQIEALAVAGAKADPRHDKSDWIRIWALACQVQDKAHDNDAWMAVFFEEHRPSSVAVIEDERDRSATDLGPPTKHTVRVHGWQRVTTSVEVEANNADEAFYMASTVAERLPRSAWRRDENVSLHNIAADWPDQEGVDNTIHHAGMTANELDDGTDLLKEGIRALRSCAPEFEIADERAEMSLIVDEMYFLLGRAMRLFGRYEERHFPKAGSHSDSDRQ